MLRLLLTRLSSTVIVIFGVISLVFLLIHLVPGDPVDVMLGENAQMADREALREALGLNRPIGQQLITYIGNLLQGDLGQSLHSRTSVSSMILERFPATLQLALVSLLVSCLIAFPLGIVAALNRGKAWDKVAMGVSLLGVSIPNFLLGPMLILLFSLSLGWLPVSGKSGFASMVLPAITLGTALAAVLSRMIRSTLLEVLNEDYIRTARAKGLSYIRVVIFHALPNAMLPIITLLGLQLGVLLGGAVITETVFSWPGIGKLTIDAITKRDYPVVQGCVLLISISYVIVNAFTDIIYGWIDPRIRQGDRS
ncbi:MAG: ABC transporter permease [Gammaproteobacteria bacterium]|nr:ABC transporter permease [Gammaproteobacteria bacterium]